MKYLIISLSFLMGLSAQAINIEFNPGNYTGNYRITSQTTSLSGLQMVDLPAPGSYQIIIASLDGFSFDLDVSGNVTVANPAAATGAAQSMSFNNVTASVNPSLYIGDYQLSAFTPPLNGINSLVFVPNLNYQMIIGGFTGIQFRIDGSGNFINISNTDATIAVGNTLNFKNSTININVNDYMGTWRIPSVTNTTTGSQSNIQLLPGLNFGLQIGATSTILINLDATGAVSTQNSQALQISNTDVIFNTESITIDPGVFMGTWFLPAVNMSMIGPATAQLVPGINYQLQSNGNIGNFSVSSPCAVDPEVVNIGGNDFTTSCTPTGFTCINKLDYDSQMSCAGRFIAKNQSDLDLYLQDYGAGSGSYKSLNINFNLTGGDLIIHSPCRIRVQSDSFIQLNNLCLSANKGVNIGSWSTISAQEDVTILSHEGNAEINSHSQITADDLTLKGALRTRLRGDASVTLNGDLTLESTGSDPVKSRAVIRPYSQVNATNINLSSFVISVIRHHSNITAGNLTLSSMGDVRVGNNANLTIDQASLVGQQEFSIGKNTLLNIIGNIEGSGLTCDVKSSAQVNAGSESGTCSPF